MTDPHYLRFVRSLALVAGGASAAACTAEARVTGTVTTLQTQPAPCPPVAPPPSSGGTTAAPTCPPAFPTYAGACAPAGLTCNYPRGTCTCLLASDQGAPMWHCAQIVEGPLPPPDLPV